MTAKAFVLLSGGVDSSTCLAIANQEFDEVTGISIDYGQRHSKELEYAARQCDSLEIVHDVISLRHVIPRTMLTDSRQDIPSIPYDQIKGVSPTYVPFRNGLMLSALVSHVSGQLGETNHREGEEWGIYFGAHSEDAQNWAYPDCTAEFIGAMANAIYIGTYQSVRLHTPLQWLTKDQVIKLGSQLGVNWQDTWSCYAGGEYHCGVCPTCRARRQGFLKAGVNDPTIYADHAEV